MKSQGAGRKKTKSPAKRWEGACRNKKPRIRELKSDEKKG